MNMKRNMGVGEKMREKQREKEIWQWWRNEKKRKKAKSKHVGGTVKTKNDFQILTIHTQNVNTEQCTQVTIHFLCMPHISRLNNKQTSGVSRGVSRLHACDFMIL